MANWISTASGWSSAGDISAISFSDRVQGFDHILITYEFAGASRIVYMARPDFEHPLEAWMGHSRGRFEGASLVIDAPS